MPSGLLVVDGEISLSQFWPDGSSDADTTKVLVQVDQDSFRFRPNIESDFQVTRIFEGAKVRGKEVINKKGLMTVRLQGVDAPELHYRPPIHSGHKTAEQKEKFKDFNHEYRQHWAESSTVALANHLAKFKKANSEVVKCKVTSWVDEPSDVFDMYGRFVGDIYPGKETQSINEWLVEQGWAFAGLYLSMRPSEVREMLAAAEKGRKKDNRPAAVWRKKEDVDESLIYRRPNEVDGFQIGADRGGVLNPKIFRRACTHYANKKAGILNMNFQAYMETKKDDLFHKTKDFLDLGIAGLGFPHKLADFVGDDSLRPEEMIYREGASTLVDAQGREVTRWFKARAVGAR